MAGSTLMNIVGMLFIVLGMVGAYFNEPETMRAACYVIGNVWIVGSFIVRGYENESKRFDGRVG